MMDQFELGYEFFSYLEQIDEEITARVAMARCPICNGPLHRGDYPRKLNGALIARAGEALCKRFSLCCGREGCRKRATPPSVRFLGRRVYLGVVVVIASIVALASRTVAASARITGVPARTLGRWLRWWRGPFVETPVFQDLRARLVGVAVEGVAVEKLPVSIVECLPGTPTKQVVHMLALLTPLTTGSVSDGARFVRVAP